MQLTSVPPPSGSQAARWLVAWLIVAAGCAAWAGYYVRQEDLAYLSDFQYYWKLYWTYGELFQLSPRRWLGDVLAAVHSSEYNPLFTVALLPFNLWMGRARVGYIEAVVLLYMLPAMAVIWFITRRWIRQAQIAAPGGVDLAILWTVALTTPLWVATLRGYPDVWALVPLGLAVWGLHTVDMARPQRWTTLAGLALCIYAPFLIRKWYVFAIVAVLMAHGGLSAWRMWRAHATRRDWGRWLFNHAAIGVLVLVCVFTVQGRMAINALSYSYAEAYVAFQRSWVEHGRDLLSRHGLLVPLWCLSGWWISARRGYATRTTFAYLWLCLALTIFLFTRVQGFGVHHHLPVGLFLAVMTGLSLAVWADVLRARPGTRRALVLGVCVLAALNFFNVLAPSSVQLPSGHLLQEQRFAPLKLDNPAAYRQLADFIEREVAPEQRVSIFASNAVLSQTMMENFLTDEGTRKIAAMAEVDEYEGFNLRPLYSDFLIAPSRPQVIDPQHQRVVAIPGTTLMERRNIGQAYREVRRIDVRPDLQFVVFRKERAFQAGELKDFLGEFATLPRPPGHAYTPMQLALLGTQQQVNSAGPRAHRIDMVGGGEWAVAIPPGADLTLSPGYWPDWLPAAPAAAPAPAPAGARPEAELVFSTQIPQGREAPCQGSAPTMTVSLDNRVLLAKTYNTPVVDFFKIRPSDVPRLRFHLQGAATAGCDAILIDHRTD